MSTKKIKLNNFKLKVAESPRIHTLSCTPPIQTLTQLTLFINFNYLKLQ